VIAKNKIRNTAFLENLVLFLAMSVDRFLEQKYKDIELER